MKQHTYIKDLKEHVGKEVMIRGFVHAHRDQNKIVFINLRDLTGTVQCVAWHELPDFLTLKNISLESVLSVTGKVKETPQTDEGYEIEIVSCEVLSVAEPELPIPVNTQKGGEEVDQPKRLDYRWLDLRRPEQALIMKVWTEFERGVREYWYANNYLQIYTPSFMGTPSETGAEVFAVDYFGQKAYLAQSPQFYKQMAIASGLERVFMAGPVFRAEHSFTTRHLTEFTGWDFELAYIESHHDVMDQEEGMLVAGFSRLKQVFPDLDITVPERPFPRMSMIEVKQRLADAGVASEEPHDLSPEEEREISRLIKEERGHEFIFITDYHISKSAFYHMRHTDDPTRSRRADLLFRGIEITTLAQREHRPEILIKQAQEKGMSLEPLEDYINFFRFGCPPHGGGGLGPGRIIMKILDLANIREATYLPRDVKRLRP